MIDTRIRDVTRRIVQLLVSGDYVEIEHETRGVRLSADQIRKAVEEYGRHLRMPPEEAFDSLDVIEVAESDPKVWSVRCDLWTHAEGRSDLSLELTLIDDRGVLRVELDNLHVL